MIGLICDSMADGHPNLPGHPESPERIIAARRGIDMAGISDDMIELSSAPASREALLRVHSQEHLDYLEQFCLNGGGMIDPDTWAGTGSFDAAISAAGAGLSAICALREGRADSAFIAVRPPGHHATRETSMGFCLINNIAVSASELASSGEKVLILDWDVHHGNGTQEIFWEDSSVLYVSTHQSPLYPGTGFAHEIGGQAALGLTVNIPLPSGATGDVLLNGLETIAGPVIDDFAPTWTLISAGFDAHRRDPLASLALSAGDFADLTDWLLETASTPGHIIAFLEGGYDLEALSMSVGAMIARLCGEWFRPEESTSGGPGATQIAGINRARHQAGG